MLRITTYTHVVIATLLVILAAVLLILVHVEVNYPPEMRDLVRPKAVVSTVVVTGVIATFTSLQFRRINLLRFELQRLVDRDRLTDVATRDCFFGRMKRNSEEDGMILIADIDRFKQINDTYGHLAGDRVIRHVAKRLSSLAAEDDVVCRFGGEEFIVFLPRRSPEEARHLAERMRASLEADPCYIDGMAIPATMSFGVAHKPSGLSVNHAIKAADAALYDAKRAGRNRVHAAAHAGLDQARSA